MNLLGNRAKKPKTPGRGHENVTGALAAGPLGRLVVLGEPGALPAFRSLGPQSRT